MKRAKNAARRWFRGGWCAAGLLAAGLTGCQVDIAGQTHPSPYWHKDDVYYAAPGPEFKLSREAAQQKAFAAQRQLETAQHGDQTPRQ